MSTQPLDTTDSAHGNDAEPDEYLGVDQREAAVGGAARQGINGTTGVGMASGMFSRFAGWTRNQLVSRSPNQDAVASGSSGAGLHQNSVNSSQTASTVSSVKTEPMRSQMLSSTTTPVSNKANTTPHSSARKTPSLTPSRSVNPLTRHLAMRAMQSTPGWSPTARRSGGSTSPLVDDSSSSLTGSVDSAMMGLAELQRQFDGFAGQLKRDATAAQAEVLESEQAWADAQSELHALRAQLAEAEAAQDLLQQQLASADRERAEWEQDRERLEEDKAALQEGVDRWRQRIGDAEAERQGAWEEGAQSRQQLLHTIVRLEEELTEARHALRETGAFEAQAEARRQQLDAEWSEERREMVQNMEDIMGAYDGLEAENNQLQAALNDRQLMLEDAAARAAEAGAEFERQLAAADKALDAATAKADALDNANLLLRETLTDLTAQNHELKRSSDDNHFFTTAVGDDQNDGLRPEKKPESSGDGGLVARLRQEHRDELQRVSNDYEMLVETMQGLNESKKRYKEENAELAAMAEAARDEIRTLKTRLEERGGAAGPSDELVQRAARLETELADLQGSGEAAELQRENTYLQTTVVDLEQQLRRSHEESDALRQAAAAVEVQLDDAQGELASAQEKLAALQASNARLSDEVTELRAQTTSSARSLAPGQRHAAREQELRLESQRAQGSLAALEAAVQQTRQRRSLLEKEQRLLASGLRDSLRRNATLRTELTEILLRRAGFARGLQRTENQLGDPDASMASGLLTHVPSDSQLLDGSSRYVQSLDRHLDEVANIVEDDAASGTARRRILTPIREEPRSAVAASVRDAATQCDNSNEIAALRVSLASARQERDQFRTSHEEAAERESRLAAQMEELGEDHERARAERITTARLALHVGRQLAVLRRGLESLAAADTAASADGDPDDGEEAISIAEEGEMIRAAFDRPLDAGDCELFGLPADADAAAAHEQMGRGELSCDHALDRIAQMVSQAHQYMRCLRRHVLRGRRERARLLRRVADSERRKLPSYELSAMWDRSRVDELDDTDPPASLLLADESAVVAEVAAARRAEQAAPALRHRVTAAAEITRLTGQLALCEKRLRAAEADVAGVEKLNRELVQRLNTAFAERVRAQQECSVAARRSSVRSASRVITPGGATDWDDVESIMQELDQCARRNTAYFSGVDQLCGVLSQHAAADRALLPGGAPADADGAPRALLEEVATVLGARASLDEQKSVRDNFVSMAAAVQEQLATQQASIRSLNSNVGLLRQQCVSRDKELHDAQMERDGWHQQFLVCEQTLTHQLNVNESLKRALSDAELDHASEDALCQAYEAQIEIAGWAARTWGAVVRAIAAPGAGAATAASAQGEALCRAADELDTGVDRATRRVNELHAAGSRGDELTEALGQVAKDLSRDFAGSWRDRVRASIVALATAASAPPTPPTTTSGPSSPSSTETAGHPRLTREQKTEIRAHYNRREQKIRRDFRELLNTTENESREQLAAAHKKTDELERTRQALVYEARYMRRRMNIEANRVHFAVYQKRCLLDLMGGQEGVFRRIDEMDRPRPRDLARQRWRRVLLAVRMKNRLQEMVKHTKEASAIKTHALQLMGKKAPAPEPRAVVAAAPQERAPILGVRFQAHQGIGLRTVPITPSRLRNRSSDVASSPGSSA
ncbi:hypothetical protein H4R19_001954 [Coemansia spiralis]|nr:hypothetical protein H4R19_001954 [Coemansia spiralis]